MVYLHFMNSMRTAIFTAFLAFVPLASSHGNENAPSPVAAPVQDSLRLPSELGVALPPKLPLPEFAVGSKEAEIDRMLALPKLKIDLYNETPLASALRLLADSCEMNYIGIPDGLLDGINVSLTVEENPYVILRQLCDRYGISMDYQDHLWSFGIIDKNELVGRTYYLRNNTYEDVFGIDSNNEDNSIVTDSRGNSARSQSFSRSSGMGRSAANATRMFKPGKSKIVEAIEKLLADLDSANVVTEGAALGRPEILAPGTVDPAGQTKAGEAKAKPRVEYSSDTNSLFVLATRAQHEVVAAYLRSVDRKQPLVKIEVKFIETAKNPKSSFGFDWSDSLGDGYGMSVGNLTTTLPLEDPSSMVLPDAIFKADDLAVKLRAFANDSDTRVVQYPRTVTLNNREVVFRSIVSRPFVSGSTSVSDATTTTQTQQDFVDVGTEINILPKILDDDRVLLSINIVVSDIIGIEELNGNPYPIVSSRVYNNQVIVKSDWTLAIGGLEQSFDSTTEGRIPWVGSIPFFGYFFKSQSKQNDNRNLIMMVTPSIIEDYHGGVGEFAEYTTPATGRKTGRRIFEGTADETIEELIESFTGMPDEIDEMIQMIEERRRIPFAKEKLRRLENEARLMLVRIEEFRILSPNSFVDLNTIESSIKREIDRIHNALRKA